MSNAHHHYRLSRFAGCTRLTFEEEVVTLHGDLKARFVELAPLL